MRTFDWKKLSRKKQDLYVRVLWEDGHSEQAIADFLQTTKGRIVVHRQRVLKLPTEGRPELKKVVYYERFRDLLDLHGAEVTEQKGVAVFVSRGILEPPTPEKEKMEQDNEPKPPSEPVAELPKSRVVESTCEWPLATPRPHERRSLCGKRVKEGHKLCEEHFALLNKKRPQR